LLQQALGMALCVHKIFERHWAWPFAALETIYLMSVCARTILVYCLLQQALGMALWVHKIFERHWAWPCAALEAIYLMCMCARII
jgi:hypothetical protein